MLLRLINFRLLLLFIIISKGTGVSKIGKKQLKRWFFRLHEISTIADW